MAEKIIEEKNNELMNRKEIKLIVKAEKNPSYEEAGKIIEEKFKSAPENIAIKQVKGKFGRNTFLISAFVYNNKEDKEKYERKKKEKKQAEIAASAPAKPEQKEEKK